jgi:hypothetical protein
MKKTGGKVTVHRQYTNKKTGRYGAYSGIVNKIIPEYEQFVDAVIKNNLVVDKGINADSLESVLVNNLNDIVNSASEQLSNKAPLLINKLGSDPFEVSSNIKQIKEYWKVTIKSLFSPVIETQHISKIAFNMGALYLKNGYPAGILNKGFKVLENTVLQFLADKNKHYSSLPYYQFVHSRFNAMQEINKQALKVIRKSNITRYHYINMEG